MGLSSIQKAAIVIETLDRQTADGLLDRLPVDQAAKLRHCILTLPTEQLRLAPHVLQEFVTEAVSPVPPPDRTPPLQRTAGASSSVALQAAAPEASSAVPEPVEGDLLGCEQPQLIAATLSIAPPEEAAAILAAMPLEVQAEVMRRMASMQRIPSDIVQSLYQQLQKQQQEAEVGRPSSFTQNALATVQRILSARGAADRKALLEHLLQVEPRLAEQLAALDPPADSGTVDPAEPGEVAA